jgi:hypothetical protein
MTAAKLKEIGLRAQSEMVDRALGLFSVLLAEVNGDVSPRSQTQFGNVIVPETSFPLSGETEFRKQYALPKLSLGTRKRGIEISQ